MEPFKMVGKSITLDGVTQTQLIQRDYFWRQIEKEHFIFSQCCHLFAMVTLRCWCECFHVQMFPKM